MFGLGNHCIFFWRRHLLLSGDLGSSPFFPYTQIGTLERMEGTLNLQKSPEVSRKKMRSPEIRCTNFAHKFPESSRKRSRTSNILNIRSFPRIYYHILVTRNGIMMVQHASYNRCKCHHLSDAYISQEMEVPGCIRSLKASFISQVSHGREIS